MHIRKNVGILAIVSALVVTVFAAVFAETSDNDGNLFKNGDFETGKLEPTKLNRYAIAALGISSEEKHNGNYSLKISNRKDQSCGWGQNVAVEEGKTYIFSGWAKVSDTAKKMSYPYSIYFFNDGSFERTSGMDVLSMQKGNEWQWTKFVRVVKSKKNATTFPCLNLWENGGEAADYYVDDLYFGELRIADIRFGNFPKEIMTPINKATVTVPLSAYAINQMGDSYGMENEQVMFRLEKEYAGIILSGNKLIISDDALTGEFRLTAYVTPSFNGLPEFSKSIFIRIVSEKDNGNLFKNGDFETGEFEPTELNRYSIAALGISSEEKHNGNYSLKILNRKDESCGWGQNITVSKEKTYIYSGYVKPADTAKATEFPYSVYFFNGGKFERSDGDDVLILRKEKEWDWTRFERVVKSKEDATTFPCLNLWKNGSGEVSDYYADDLYFGELRVADIQFGSFKRIITIPKDGTAEIVLSAYAINQLGDSCGMKNEEVTFKIIGQHEGVILSENKLKISNKAEPTVIYLEAEVKPSFNDLPIISKKISIELSNEELNDYRLSGEWERTESRIRYKGEIIKQNDVNESVNCIAAVYNSDGALIDVSMLNLGEFSKQKTITTDWLECIDKDTYKLFLWYGSEELGMIPADVTDEAEMIYFYVSNDGDDSNDGTFYKPFKTITRARNEIRNLSLLERSKKTTVFLREGEYNETLHFGAADSGNVTYAAYPGEQVFINGAKKIKCSELKKVSNKNILARIPAEVQDKIYCISLDDTGIAYNSKAPWYGRFSYTVENFEKEETLNYNPNELFCNDKAMTLARYPNNGNLKVQKVIVGGSKGNDLSYGDSWEPFTVEVNDDRIAKWKSAPNALLYGHWKYLWANQSMPLKTVDVENGYITSKYPAAFGVKEGQNFYIYNLIEELDSEGEYYIEDGVLYVYMSGDENEFEFSNTTTPLMTLNSCKGIKIEKINFKNTCASAIKCTDVDNVVIADCEIYNTAGYAVEMSGKNSGIYNCYIHDVDGGIKISGGDRKTLTSGGMYVENCEFVNFARNTRTYTAAIYPMGVGVSVKNNKIHDSEHLAIEFSGNDHLFEYNEIYDVCQNTDDAGAIYAGRDPIGFGNVWRHNYIHDIGTNEYPDASVYGIYMDDGQSGGYIYGNIFENITGAGIHHAGRESTIENNIFINNGKSVLYTYRDGSALLQNLPSWYSSKVWTERFPGIENIKNYMNVNDWNQGHILNNNIRINTEKMWCNDSRIQVFSGAEYETKKDPGFEDYINKKYNLKEDSVVFEQLSEFESIPFDKIGRKRRI